MERLAEGVFFQHVVEEDESSFIKFTVVNGEPEQKTLSTYWPMGDKINWHKVTQLKFYGDDLHGKGYVINIKRMHPEVPMMSINVTQFAQKYIDTIFAVIAGAIDGKLPEIVNWIVAADPFTLEAEYQKAFREIKEQVSIEEKRHF